MNRQTRYNVPSDGNINRIEFEASSQPPFDQHPTNFGQNYQPIRVHERFVPQNQRGHWTPPNRRRRIQRYNPLNTLNQRVRHLEQANGTFSNSFYTPSAPEWSIVDERQMWIPSSIIQPQPIPLTATPTVVANPEAEKRMEAQFRSVEAKVEKLLEIAVKEKNEETPPLPCFDVGEEYRAKKWTRKIFLNENVIPVVQNATKTTFSSPNSSC